MNTNVNNLDFVKPLKLYITKEKIKLIIKKLASEIDAFYTPLMGEKEKLLCCTVLKGGFIFAADLFRALSIEAEIEFVRVSSYEKMSSSKKLTFRETPQFFSKLSKRHCLIMDDIIDTGYTYQFLRHEMLMHSPESIHLATLLNKPSQRVVEIEPTFFGTIVEGFVVGYGMGYDEQYRQLPDLYQYKEDV